MGLTILPWIRILIGFFEGQNACSSKQSERKAVNVFWGNIRNGVSSMRTLAILLVLCLPISAFAFAPFEDEVKAVKPTLQEGSRVYSASQSASALVKSSFPKVSVEVDSLTGSLRCIQGPICGPMAGNAIDIADKFITENGSLFGEANFSVGKIVKHDGTTHISYDQVVDGVKVFGQSIKVNVNQDGSITLVNGDVVTVNAPRIISEGLTKDEAIAAAMTNLRSDEGSLRGEVTTDKAWLPMRDRTALVWIVRVPSLKPLGDYEVHVDAQSGEVLSCQNFLQALETGRGDVYATNPLKSQVTEKPLHNMSALSALKGPYAKVINDDVDEASEADGVYKYDKDNTHFDEAMVYHHLNIIHDYFKKEHGYKGLDKVMEATVHYGTNYDNAFYSPWTGGFAFGDGNRLNDLAKEASVIYHEYTHAVTGQIVHMQYANESGAMNEGFSDYFGCLLTNDSKLGEWTVKKLGKPYMRWLEDTVHYPEDIHGEVHHDGKIWGCACWDLKKALGEKVASKIIHKCRYYLSYRAKFVDGLRGLIEADKVLYGGAHVEKIKEVLAGRGISLPAETENSEDNMRYKELYNE